jgi:hypothetical protein
LAKSLTVLIFIKLDSHSIFRSNKAPISPFLNKFISIFNSFEIINGMLIFDFTLAAISSGNHDFSLVAIKNDAYSRPTAPSFNCRVE